MIQSDQMSPSPLTRTIVRISLLVLVLSSLTTADQQRFLDQPWDVTVVAGDKVREQVNM